MDKPASLSPDRTELFLRYVRRSLWLSLAVTTAGALYLALTVWDRDGHLERLRGGLLTAVPIVLTFGLAWLQSSLKGNRFSRRDPDVRAVIEDELRRQSFHRAFRAAFVAVLLLQMPLAWILSRFPGGQGLLHMGTFTILIGFITLAGSFLFFDRD